MRKLPKWGSLSINALLEYVTLPVSRPPVYEDKFHLVDKFPSLEPVTYTLVWEPKSQNVLEVLSIDGITEPVTAVQVTDVTVQFSKEIDPSTFSWEDMSLTFQGGADIMNNSVVITQLDTATFSVDISSLTTGNGFYNLTVQAAGVEDIYGICGETGKQLTWSQFLTVPKVQAFLGLPEGNIATTFDTLWVQFNLPIDLATISGESFYLLKDEVQLEAKVNLDSVSEDQMLFYLSGLDILLTESGTYELVVKVPEIKSVEGEAGLEQQSVELTVNNEGPKLLSMEKFYSGGLDAQHVTAIHMAFDEQLQGFNVASLKLTRNGEVLYLAIDQLSTTDLKNWTAGNLGMLTYPEGEYTFTVNLPGFSDVIDNVGVGTQKISWTVNRSATIGISSFAVSPDLGHSNSDGITSVESLAVTFTLDTNAAEVVISQIDFNGSVLLTTVADLAAGAHTIPVTLKTGGNTGLEVATGVLLEDSNVHLILARPFPLMPLLCLLNSFSSMLRLYSPGPLATSLMPEMR